MRERSLKLALSGALSVLILAACDNSTSPDQADKSTVKADLQRLSANAKYFGGTIGSLKGEALLKRTAGQESAKRSADYPDDPFPKCHDGMLVLEFADSTDPVRPSISKDTTRYFDASGKPACPEDSGTDPLTGGSESESDYYKDPIYESWIHFKSEYIYDIRTDMHFKYSGSGRVHYFSGYDMTIDAIAMEGGMSGMTAYRCDLGLENGRYQVPMAIADGVDLNSETRPSAATVVLHGPIQLHKETVGYLDVMGDDRIVVRDADKNIVEVH
jgi:hypothetical protein